MSFNRRKYFFIYTLKFLSLFFILYYGVQAWIGITTPGNYHSPFFQKYFDGISVFRKALMNAAGAVTGLFGHPAAIVNVYDLKLSNGRGVHIVYSCLGIGVMSFWAAFIFANEGSGMKKIKWAAGGLLAIFCINVIRVSLMLLAIAYNWKIFHEVDNHVFFNITAYIMVFVMIYFYDRSSVKEIVNQQEQPQP